MSHPLTVKTVYVEGPDDVRILQAWHPNIQFTSAGGKDSVERSVQQHPACHGLKDRDFADDAMVAASLAAGSRLALMHRYCIENYLLEPEIIAEAVRAMPAAASSLTTWTDEAFVRGQLAEWAAEMALYAAANSIVAEWRQAVEADFLRYFGPLPPMQPLSRDQVVQELQRRLASLIRPEEVEDLLEARFRQVEQDIMDWDGFHRWINGKVLLEGCLYPRVFEPTGISQARLRDALIEAGEGHVPAELQELAARWNF
jgi:hypothetical protein